MAIGAAQALLFGTPNLRRRRRMGPTPPRSKRPKKPTRTIITGSGRPKPSKPIFSGAPGRRPTTRPLPAGPKRAGSPNRRPLTAGPTRRPLPAGPNRGPRRRIRSIAAGPIGAMSGRGGKRPTRRGPRRRSY